MKLARSFYRVNFDLHRAGGLWLWAMLLVFAWSSVFFTLAELLYARDAACSRLRARPSGRGRTRRHSPRTRDADGMGGRAGNAARLMAELAREHGFTVERPLALYIVRDKGLYEYRVRSSRDIGDKYGSDLDPVRRLRSGELRHLEPADRPAQPATR